MKVLFGMINNKVVEKIVKCYEKIYKEKIEYKITSNLDECISLLSKDYYRLVLSEELIINYIKNKSNDTEFFKYIKYIMQNFNRNNIIFIAKGLRKQNDIFLYKLVCLEIYTILARSNKTKVKICKCINKPLSLNDIKKYYNKFNYSDVGKTIINENELEKIMNMFYAIKENNSKIDNLFNKVVSQYTKEQMDIVINWIPDEVKEYLNSNNEFYKNIVKNSFIKVKVRYDSILNESSILKFIARFKNLNGDISRYNYVFDNWISEYSSRQKMLIVGNLQEDVKEFLQKDNELYQNLEIGYKVLLK